MSDTLRAAFNDLQGAIGFYLGFGRGADNGEEEWDDNKKRTIKQLTKSGMRKLYYCGFNWSFLKPVAQLTLSEGDSTVKLPEDYQSAEGDVIPSVSGGSSFVPLKLMPIGLIYQKEAAFPGSTGRPEVIAEEPLKQSFRGQTHQLHVFPTADQDYTLTFQYNLNPAYLTGDMPLAYGGQEHSETLLAACRASAEIELDNLPAGPQFQEFMRLLETSKDIDGRNKPHSLGLNLDKSDRSGRYRRWGHGWENITATIAGLTPSSGST